MITVNIIQKIRNPLQNTSKKLLSVNDFNLSPQSWPETLALNHLWPGEFCLSSCPEKFTKFAL